LHFLSLKAPTYKEKSPDESDHTDYNDLDYAPDSEGSSSELDEDTELHPVPKKPLLSLRYPLLSSASQAIDSETPVKKKTPETALRKGTPTLQGREEKELISSFGDEQLKHSKEKQSPTSF